MSTNPESRATLLTYPSRVEWNLLEPAAADVRLADIAHSLAGQARFNAHTHAMYSVAQHSVFVLDLLDGRRDQDYPRGLPAIEDYASLLSLDALTRLKIRLTALFHDGHEAYLGDLIGPLKAALRAMAAPFGMTSPIDYLEARHDRAIFTALRGSSWKDSTGGDWLPSVTERSFVKVADKLAYRVESNQLRLTPEAADHGHFYQGRILGQEEAMALFMERANALLVEVEEGRDRG